MTEYRTTYSSHFWINKTLLSDTLPAGTRVRAKNVVADPIGFEHARIVVVGGPFEGAYRDERLRQLVEIPPLELLAEAADDV